MSWLSNLFKSKTKVVGGRPVEDTAAADFSNLIKQGLQTGNFGTGAFGDAINSMLTGSAAGDPMNLTQFFGQGGGSVNNLPGIGVNFQIPDFLSAALTNPLQGQDINFQSAQFQGAGPFQNANLNQNVGGLNDLPQIGGGLNNLPQIGGGLNNLPLLQQLQLQFQNPNLNTNYQTGNPLTGIGQVNTNTSDRGMGVDAIEQLVNRNIDRQALEARARFTGSGNARGTPAAYAEALTRSEAAPMLANALNQASMQQRGLAQQDVAAALGQRGQDITGQLQAMGLGNEAISQLNNALLAQAGMQNQFGLEQGQLNQQGQLANLQALLQNQGMQQQGDVASIQAMLQNQGMQQQGDVANIQAMLQNQGLSNDAINQLNQLMLQQSGQQNQFNLANADMANQFGMNQAGMQNQFNLAQRGQNIDANSLMNQLMLQQSGMQNQFNQGNAQFGANLDQQAQMANLEALLQNQQMGNQFNLGLGNLFTGLQQNQLGAQQNMLGMLFNSMNNLSALGTPQAGVVQSPSMFSQVTGGLGNLFGGIGAAMQGWQGLQGGGGLPGQPGQPPNQPQPARTTPVGFGQFNSPVQFPGPLGMPVTMGGVR